MTRGAGSRVTARSTWWRIIVYANSFWQAHPLPPPTGTSASPRSAPGFVAEGKSAMCGANEGLVGTVP